MSFYLEPPTGNISLQNVENYAFKRLKFLLKIYEHECEGNSEKWTACFGVDDLMGSECLIEGTTKDQISHFILRLTMCLEPDTAKFFTQAEARLFDFRFQSMSKEELISLFRKVERTLQRIQKKLSYQSHWSEIISIVSMVKSDLACWKAVIKMFKTSEKKCCFSVPFNIVPSLVAKRKVIIHKGTALVPYCYLDVVMSSLFKQTLLLGVKRVTAQRETTLQDPRIRILAKRLQMKFRRHCKPHTDYKTTPSLSHDQVQEMLPWFPPCMSHLHHRLRKNHRLPHHSRIQYTLFLKEIGMPVHESLKFWKDEYSITVDNKHSCHHDWKSDGKRYTYNIRHLYGLEGAHTNYRGHCCHSLQHSVQGHSESGGCPFKHFDQRHLQELLQKEKIEKSGDITKLALEEKYTEACERFFEEKVKNVLMSEGCVNNLDKTSAEVSVLRRKRKTEDMEENYCSSTSAETHKNSSTICGDCYVNSHTLVKSHRAINVCLMTGVPHNEMTIISKTLDKTNDETKPQTKEKGFHAFYENKARPKIYRSESDIRGRDKSTRIGKCKSGNRHVNVHVNNVNLCSRPEYNEHSQKQDGHGTKETEKKHLLIRCMDNPEMSSGPFINVLKHHSPSLKAQNCSGRKFHSGQCHTKICSDMPEGHSSDGLFEGQGDLQNHIHKKCETGILQVKQKCKKQRLNNCSMCRGDLGSAQCPEKRNEVIMIRDDDDDDCVQDNNDDGTSTAGNNCDDDNDENSDDNDDHVDDDDISDDGVANDDYVDHDDSVDGVSDDDDDEDEEVYNVLDMSDKIHHGDDGIECFDHDICPSQMCRAKTQQSSPARSNTSKIQLQKPADFFFSFKELVQGLQQLNVKT